MKRKRKKGGCIHTIAVTVGMFCLAVAVICIAYGVGLKTQIVGKIEREFTKPKEIPFQEVVLSEDEVEQKFYYQQLNEEDIGRNTGKYRGDLYPCLGRRAGE